MPFDGQGGRQQHLVSGEEILQRLRRDFELTPVVEPAAAMDEVFRVADWPGRVGIIRAHSRTFCGSCTRLRISPRGELRTCLYGPPVADLKSLLRGAATDAELAAAVRQAVAVRLADGVEAEQAGDRDRVSMSVIGG
jgi:cyclic pyranopterin phosphate synthase